MEGSVYTMKGLIGYHVWSVDKDCQEYCVGESRSILRLSRKEAYDWLEVSAMGKGTESGGMFVVW